MVLHITHLAVRYKMQYLRMRRRKKLRFGAKHIAEAAYCKVVQCLCAAMIMNTVPTVAYFSSSRREQIKWIEETNLLSIRFYYEIITAGKYNI